MFQTLSKKLRKKQGFTLIELIVVLAILGIILAIAVPNYLGVQAKAAEDADERTAQLIAEGAELWYVAEGVNGATTFKIVLTESASTPVWNTSADAVLTLLDPATGVTPTTPTLTQGAALVNYIDLPLSMSVGTHNGVTITVVDGGAGNPPTITTAFN